MKTAILGGSFDPVHLGHLFLLHCAVEQTDYERFLIIPAWISNFKQNSAPKASDVQRLKMLALALEDYRDLYPSDTERQIELSTIELDRGGISYTYDTVCQILSSDALVSGNRLGLIMGDDHVDNLSGWYRYGELKTKVEFLICNRTSNDDFSSRLPKDIEYRVIKPENVAVETSTAVRNNLAENLDYLSPRVRDYILENKIYV